MEEMVFMEKLINGEREAKIEAAIQISKLSTKQRRKLAEKGIIINLVSMLNYYEDYEAMEAALFALLTLAFGSERNKIKIVKSGVIPLLLQLLQSEYVPVIDLSMAAMVILSSCAANKREIALSGSIQLLVTSILNVDCISLQAKLDAISTLHNLATCSQIIPSIVSSGVTFTLLQLIENSSELSEKSIELLESLVSSSNEALQVVSSTNGAIRVLVEAVEEGWSTRCQEHAVGILLRICRSCRDTYRGLILKEGVMPGLLQVSVDGTFRAKEMARELLFLLRDCSSFGSSKRLKNVVVEQIMREIDEGGEKIPGRTLRLVEEMIAKLST